MQVCATRDSSIFQEHPIELFTAHTPPHLEHVLGYTASKRWVAFFCGKKVGQTTLCYGFDGSTFNPVNPAAWDAFCNHPLMVSMNHRRSGGITVKRFEFGDEQTPSEFWLLLDRCERLMYAARKESALQYLQSGGSQAELEPDPGKPESGRIKPHAENGGLQKIKEMVEWLDRRKEELTREGSWPKFE